MAGIYKDQGNLYLAEKLYLKSLEIDTEIFGSNHTKIADTNYNLAEIYKVQGKEY